MDVILVINAGSSSIKFSAFSVSGDTLTPLAAGKLEEIYTNPRFQVKRQSGETIEDKRWPEGERLGHDAAIKFLLAWLGDHSQGANLLAVGHRIVHGGSRYTEPVRITPAVMTQLEALIPLAPLHQPHNLAAIDAIASHDPDLPQVACFDTAFHHTQPNLATRFALPPEITGRGVRRYGFHGLSYEYIARTLPDYDARAALGKTVVLHLGNGASMTAMSASKSVASTMGFTAVEGLPMGTRSGSLDPGVVLWMMEEAQMDANAISALLYKRSGLLGVSGISSDMRTLLDSDDPRAAEAVDLFCYRISRELGSLAAALGGLDAIVFTAGIGERAAAVRERVGKLASWLGVSIDPAANARHGPRISTADSRVDVWVIPTNEELMIALHTFHRLER
ncbi:acetate/propionate family kinase [Paraburkholderia sp.]|uniref:acetate/propionate family kinase n=1 Tax=Paraburkholderia sp. TaxID=1926495 RepID=UPI00238C21EE|nr:acetate/propionate family kinase [Paraburkholderia sp.]MDE1179068.1 acetate/propionate family kinase [Paraburkholderia sp.]